jgi:hypothetical protein
MWEKDVNQQILHEILNILGEHTPTDFMFSRGKTDEIQVSPPGGTGELAEINSALISIISVNRKKLLKCILAEIK